MITAVKNQSIRNLVQLNQKAKTRREQKAFVAEGLKMFLEAPLSWIREVYISESFAIQISDQKGGVQDEQAVRPKAAETAQKLEQCRQDGIRVETVSEEVFRKIADTMSPQGILCVVGQPEYQKEELYQCQDPLWMILEDLQDPGNVGTILRTGEGAGITGVILTKGCVDLFNPKTIRATMGSIYRVPFFYTEQLSNEVKRLKEQHITVYAAHLEGRAWYDEASYQVGSAFLIGNEGNGLRRETAALADSYLKIPMQGQVESLNAASAASILMYEAARQRRKKKNR